VFDGHGGKHAADFACYHLPRFIAEDEDFPVEVERVIASAFLQTDSAFAKACSLDAALASGTTALAALVVGRLAFIHPPTVLYVTGYYLILFLGALNAR
jgi:protein phosphatase 2C family protein 2/3